MIGRAADQAVACVGDRLHSAHPPRQIFAAAAALPRQPDALAVLLECEEIALRRVGFQIVQARDGAGAVAERRMAGDVVDPLGAHIDDAAVAHAF